ncbi:MAG: outer membrane protein assembly factor BamB [Legionellaceae bacterium]|nr:outer membrane protein assembly factor BamB [Legionellaceae bacterium]HAF87242.1 outer membrane protein assembly factor BamB [Legionellales bacterium]HCA88850.1 outer membrane protein assembly factor BamB [Legionellales bacterium]
MKILINVCLCLMLVACNKVDDYLLGVDNTPTPNALKALVAQKKVTKKWQIAAGESSKKQHLKIKPVVLGQIVYTASTTGRVQATNRFTGQVIWSTNIRANILSGPSVAGHLLVVGTGSSSIVALNSNTGHIIWQKTLSSDALAKPVIYHHKVIVKTINGFIYALEASTGKKIWQVKHGAPSLILKASSSPVMMKDNIMLVGFSDGKIDAIDISTGQLIWQRSIAYGTGASDIEKLVSIDANPIVEHDTVWLATYQGYIAALSLKTGQYKWRHPASTFLNLAVFGQNLLMVDSRDVIWSINKYTGNINWQQKQLKARGLTEPVLMGNKLIVGDKTGLVHIISAENGQFLARLQLDSAVSYPVSTLGHTMYVMTSKGQLNCFVVSK